MNKSVIRVLSIAACLVLAGSLGAFAGSFSTMQGDCNVDGKLTCGEAKTQALERFTAMDTNKDKQLSMNELEDEMSKIFNDADTNKDGIVTVEEYVTYWCGTASKGKAAKASAKGGKKSQFQKMDANGDGNVTADECVAYWTIRFNDVDDNKDGKLTKHEYTQSLIMLFGDMDMDKDSTVTVTEYTKYWIGACQAEKMKKKLKGN
jgi:Ca2+-binding EF-hand superfamily protein